MHANGRGVEDGVKVFRAQGAARYYFAPYGAGQFFRSFLAARANPDDGARAR